MPKHKACAAAAALTTLTALANPGDANAATLLAFTFEDADGSFATTPTTRADAFGDVSLDVATGSLGEVSGNPGRALRANGFTAGNAVTLQAPVTAGWRVRITRVGFDQRASASGPSDWSLALDGTVVASGATSSDFTSISQPLDIPLEGGALTLVVAGSGASSALGTLRIDNLFVEGNAQLVPLPPAAVLAALPLAALRCRRRPGDTATRAMHRAAGSTVRA